MVLYIVAVTVLVACGQPGETDSASGGGKGTPRTSIAKAKKALKIECIERGIFRVTGKDLQDQGLDLAALDPDRLSLVQERQSVPIMIEGAEDGKIDAGDAIYFHAEGIFESKIPYINIVEDFDPPTEIFMLYLDDTDHRARRYRTVEMQTPDGPDAAYPVLWTQGRLHFEDNPIWKFFDDVRGIQAETNYLFWSEITVPETDKSTPEFQTGFALPATDPEQPIVLRIQFLGVSQDSRFHANKTHRVQVRVNNAFETVVEWPTGEREIAEISLPPGVGRTGGNTLTFTLLEPGLRDAGRQRSGRGIGIDDVLIDWFDVRFVQATRVFNNYNEFVIGKAKPAAADAATSAGESQAAAEPLRFSILDFQGDKIHVFDVDRRQYFKTRPFQQEGGQWEFGVNMEMDQPATGPTRLVALTDRAMRAPFRFTAIPLTDHFKQPKDCELLVLTHSDFLEEIQRYVEWKRSRGLKVGCVAANELFDEISGGYASPDAIRDYIRHVYESQEQPKLKYVLLVGDSTTIAKYKAFMPAYSYLQSGRHANDNFFANFTSPQANPEVAVGRYSVRTVEQLRNAIDKTIAYEKKGNVDSWRGTVLLIAASQHWAEQDAQQLAEWYFTPKFAPRMLKTDVMAREQDYAERINAELMSLMNDGNLITVFLGHGGGTVWEVGPTNVQGGFTRHLFNQSNVERMTNENRLPVIFALTCYTNDFDNPYVTQTLGETFVNSPNGAVAVIGAAERTFVETNFKYTRAFFEMMEERRFERLGDYFVEAKKEVGSTRANTNYLLLGDPTLEFNLPKPGIEVSGLSFKDGDLRFDYRLPEAAAATGKLHCVVVGNDWTWLGTWEAAVSGGEGTVSHSLSLTDGITSGSIRHVVVYAKDDAGNDFTGGIAVKPVHKRPKR